MVLGLLLQLGIQGDRTLQIGSGVAEPAEFDEEARPVAQRLGKAGTLDPVIGKLHRQSLIQPQRVAVERRGGLGLIGGAVDVGGIAIHHRGVLLHVPVIRPVREEVATTPQCRLEDLLALGVQGGVGRQMRVVRLHQLDAAEKLGAGETVLLVGKLLLPGGLALLRGHERRADRQGEHGHGGTTPARRRPSSDAGAAHRAARAASRSGYAATGSSASQCSTSAARSSTVA